MIVEAIWYEKSQLVVIEHPIGFWDSSEAPDWESAMKWCKEYSRNTDVKVKLSALLNDMPLDLIPTL